MRSGRFSPRIRRWPGALGLLAGLLFLTVPRAAADPPPEIRIDDAVVVEGDQDTSHVAFTVRLSAVVGSGRPSSVDFATADSTATTADHDYVATSGTLEFATGQLQATIEVPVLGDRVTEADEGFLLLLSNPIRATLADSSAAGTIVNDDAPPGLRIEDGAVAEGDSGTVEMAFVARLSHASDFPVSVDYATADSTARVSDGDYEESAGTLGIAPRDTAGSILVAIQGDMVPEVDQAFVLNLGAVTGASLETGRAVGAIVDEDTLRASFVRVIPGFSPYFSGTLAPAFGDYDGDLFPDLTGYHNDGDGSFTMISGFFDLLNGGNFHGSAWADYDRDGHPDLSILGYSGGTVPSLLLHNQGDGSFADVAPALGMDVAGFGETQVWGDFDGDGWPDLFTPYYSHVFPFRSFLYHNNGDGTFAEIGDSAGVSMPNLPENLKPEGASAADWDDDGDLDLYCASHLFLNDGYGRFTDVRADVGLPARFDEGAMFVDYDNDGDFDLYLRYTDGPRLFRNDAGWCVDVSAAVGLEPAALLWGDSWADVDNDGDLDLLYLLPASPARLMLNQGDGTFVADSLSGLDFGIGLSAWADVDGDGDLDAIEGEQTYRLHVNLLAQQAGSANSSIRVRVVDEFGARSAQGATVRLRRVGDPAGAIQTRLVAGGSAYLAQSEYPVHFGTYADARYALEVVYPSRPGLRTVVGPEENPMLGELEPQKLAGRTVVVYPSGVVLLEQGEVTGVIPPHIATRASASLGLPAPNPIRGATRIAFQLPAAATASVGVFDVLGRRVRLLDCGERDAGTHTVSWDRSDDRGSRVGAGVYFLRLMVNGRPQDARRVVVLD